MNINEMKKITARAAGPRMATQKQRDAIANMYNGLGWFLPDFESMTFNFASECIELAKMQYKQDKEIDQMERDYWETDNRTRPRV